MAAAGLLRPQAARLTRATTPSALAVDIHSHWLPRSWPDFAQRYGGVDWPSMRSNGPLPGGTFGYQRHCSAMLMKDGQDFRPVTKACWDIPTRLADLDAHGVEHQLLSATPILFQWHQPADVGLDVAKYFNDELLEHVRRPEAAGRLHALCQVPLQNIDLAMEELSRAKRNGHKGVQIGNHVGEKDLDDEGIIAFLRHCADEDFPVFVHPWDMANPDGRLTKYMMGWTVGMPMETHLSIVAMLLSGAFDRLPTTLRLCFAHGGGAFPQLVGRLENAWLHREIARGKSRHPPRHYLDRFSVDSAVFGQAELRLLLDTMGEDRILLGSDYPFPLGEQQIGSLVRSSNDLSTKQKDKILRTNAARFFGIDLDRREAAVAQHIATEAAVSLEEPMDTSLGVESSVRPPAAFRAGPRPHSANV